MSGAVKAVVSVVVAVAIPFVAPAIASSIGLSTAIGTAVGSATAGSVIGGALTGAALGATKAAVLGEDVGRGALMGGIGGGVGGYTAAPMQAPVAATAGGTVPNAVVTNVGSGTGYWSPELAQYVDPSTGSTIASQNVAYGGFLPPAEMAQLQQGQLSASQLAGVGQTSPMLQGISANTPTATTGFGPAQLGSTAYFSPDIGTGAFAPQTGFTNATTGATYTASPTYAQAGLNIPASQLATVGGGTTTGGVATPGTPTVTAAPSAASVVPGAPGVTYGTATGATTPVGTVPTATGGAAPTTYSAALRERLTNPVNMADFTLRAAGMLAGSALAGDGLSDEERQLLQAQTEELRMLQQTNRELFNQRLEQAYNLVGESEYFNPEYFGLQRARRAQLAGAKAKRAGLRGLTGAARESEERRFDLATARDTGTAYDQGFAAGQTGRLQTMQAGLSAMPASFPSSMGDYSNLRSAYGYAANRARQTQADIGELFGSFTGAPRSMYRGYYPYYG